MKASEKRLKDQKNEKVEVFFLLVWVFIPVVILCARIHGSRVHSQFLDVRSRSNARDLIHHKLHIESGPSDGPVDLPLCLNLISIFRRYLITCACS
jgi:hypothetical protein